MDKKSEEELDRIANQITMEMQRSLNAKKPEDKRSGSSAQSPNEDDAEDETADS